MTVMDEGQEIESERRDWEAEQRAEYGPRLVPRPTVTRAADRHIRILVAGDEVGGETIPHGHLGVLLGGALDPMASAFLVVGRPDEVNRWMETLRFKLLDVPTGGTCSHCLRAIVRPRVNESWMDDETGDKRCPLSPNGWHRPAR